MKHSSFKAVCLIVLAFVTVLPSFGDNVSVDLESRIIEAFNGDSNYTWKAEGSKFTNKSGDTPFPRLNYVDAWPIAIFGHNRDGSQTIKSLGINGSFDRQEYNWIDIYPTSGDNTPAEIPLPGRIRSVDLWVWGSNLHIYVETYLRDHKGVVHTIPMGDVYYTGWKNLKANIPNTIPQSKRQLPLYAGLTFVKFRIWTQPVENVRNFYVYFKQLKVLTDIFESYYDGDDLADPEQVQKLWANAAN